MRLCIASGLNMPDSLQKPLPARTRESLLMGAPLSHTDVELRRNVFWLSYCTERYHLAPDSWGKYIMCQAMRRSLQHLVNSIRYQRRGYSTNDARNTWGIRSWGEKQIA